MPKKQNKLAKTVKVSTKHGAKLMTIKQASAHRAQSNLMRAAWAIARAAAKKYGGKPSEYMQSGVDTSTGEAVAGAVQLARRQQNAKYKAAWNNFFNAVVGQLRGMIALSSLTKAGKKDATWRLDSRVIGQEATLTDEGRAAGGSYLVNSGEGAKIERLLTQITFSSEQVSLQITNQKWLPVIRLLKAVGLDVAAKDVKAITAILNIDITQNIDMGADEVYE